jgi:hypothetical protein
MKKVFSILLILITLVGCRPSLPTLETPSNIRLEAGQLKFDAVTHATLYIIEINGITHETSNTYYDLAPGEIYQIRVKATASTHQDSPYSEIFTFDLTITPEVPTNLRITDSSVTWDAMQGAINYILTINNLDIHTTTNSISLEPYFTNQMTITVEGIYPHGRSEKSAPILYNNGLPYLYSFTLNYSKQSTIDLDLHILTQRDIFNPSHPLKDAQGNTLSETNFASNKLLKSSYLSTLNVGAHKFYLSTSFGDYEFIINITNTDRPYMISGSEIYNTGSHPANFYFELFGGTITALSGNQIQTSDYLINPSHIQIQASYISSMFENPERQTLILSYTLEKGNQIVIGYIFIKRLILE